MIALIRGRILIKTPQYSVIDVNGIGYKVFTPLSSFPRLPPLKEEIILHTYMNVREDAIQLYGFLSIEERDFFVVLLTISGIGPKMGLNIMSGTSLSNLMEIVKTEDVRRLSMIPGVGKKTAARIVLELKEKLVSVSSPVREGIDQKISADALSALVNLGYKPSQAQEAIEIAIHGSSQPSLEDVIREALKNLSKSSM